MIQRRVPAIVVAVTAILGACGEAEQEATVFEEVGFVGAANEAALQDELTASRAAQEAAAACMREQGFVYEPWSEVELLAGYVDAPGRVGTIEYAQERGYGILFSFPEQIKTHPSAKQNPNQVYGDGLSDSEKFVFYQTLLGPDGGDGVRRESVDEALYAEGGCLGRELRATGDFERSNLLGQLIGPYEQLEAQANADERLTSYDTTWSTCMADLGFTYESSPRVIQLFQQRFDELWASVSFPATGYTTEELQSLSEAERAALYAEQPRFDEQQWQGWRDEEQEVATADVTCQGDSPRQDILVAILAENEERFLAENAAIVEQLQVGDG